MRYDEYTKKDSVTPMEIKTIRIERRSLIIASATIACMMTFLWQAAWPAPFIDLVQEKGSIVKVYPHLSWVDVDVQMEDGRVLTCSGRSYSKTCSEAAFLAAQEKGGEVRVWHNGSRMYQVIGSDGAVVVPYMAFAEKRLFVLGLETLLLGMFGLLVYHYRKTLRA